MITERVGLSQSATSQHLRMLRNLQLVTGRRQGREVLYELADVHVGRIVSDANPLRQRREPRPMSAATEHAVHDSHGHAHAADCEHAAVDHAGHRDFVHDAHRHAQHESHWDEH